MRKKQIFSCIVLALLLTACTRNDEIQEESVTIEETEESTVEKTADGDTVLAWSDLEEIEIDIDEYEPEYNPHQHLEVPTYITKIDDMYFIADCYNDQIIYHDNLEDTLPYWHVLTDEVHYAHTIASDGTVYLVDDTENNRVLIFEKVEDKFLHTQTFNDIGQWPHYIQYVPQEDAFFAWSSVTGEMYIFHREKDSNRMYLSEIRKIPELYGIYVRSFSLIGDEIYFVSGHGNAKIIKADRETFAILKEYDVPAQIAGMAQISKIDNMYYITVSTDAEENQDYATIIRTDTLEDLIEGRYEDIYEQFTDEVGTPYYITEIEGTFYMTNHRTEQGLFAFEVVDGELENIRVIY